MGRQTKQLELLATRLDEHFTGLLGTMGLCIAENVTLKGDISLMRIQVGEASKIQQPKQRRIEEKELRDKERKVLISEALVANYFWLGS